MKPTIALQQFKKCITLFMVGIVCSSLTYVIYIVDPVNMIVEYNIRLVPNTFMYSIWKKIPVDIYVKVYIFNITNPVEFLEGKEKLKVEEVGPYVYQEYLEHDNITYHDNGTMTYIPRRTVVYVPELSVNDPTKDMVMVPNVPVLGVFSALHDAGFLVNYPLVRLANMMNTKWILNISAYEYLWGHEEPLVAMASRIVPNFINFRKFGLLDRMYDQGEDIITINLRKNADMKEEKGRYLSIETFNGSPGFSHWGYEEPEDNTTETKNTICNRIQGASEGIIFPPYPDKKVVFRAYRKAFCRTLPINFVKEVFLPNGLPGYMYKLADNFADHPDENPDNECYCRKMKTCFKKGLSNITPCYYNIPAAVSLPHFLDADPSLLEDVEGLKPDLKKHESFAVLQPGIGMPLMGHSRMQTNLIMNHIYYNPKIVAFNDKTIPLFWFDVSISNIPTYLSIILKLGLQIMPIVQTVLMYILGIVGATMILLSLLLTIRVFNQQQSQQEPEMNRVDNPDSRMPLCYGQYTAINILPTVKKITSKTDLFS